MNYTNNVYFTLIFTYCVYYSVVTFSVSCYIHHGSFMRVLIDILVVEWCWLLLRLLQRNDELWIVGHSRREWTCVVLLIEMLEVHLFFWSFVLNWEDSDGSAPAQKEKCRMEFPVHFHHLYFARLCESLVYTYRLLLMRSLCYCFITLQASGVNQQRSGAQPTHPFISNLIMFLLFW